MITASQVIKDTLQLYTNNFRTILKYTGTSLFIWLLLAINSIVFIPFYMRIMNEKIGLVVAILTQLVIIGLFFLLAITLTKVLQKIYINQKIDSLWLEILSSKKKFIPAIIVGFLVGGIVFAGCLLLLIPGIVCAVWFYFSPLVVVLDDQKPITALKMSYSLVSRRFGETLWNLIAPLGVYIVIFVSTSWMIQAPGQYFLMVGGNQMAFWISALLMLLFYFFFLPIIALSPIIVYENLKKTNEPVAN